MNEFLLSLLGVFIGGLATLVTARIYYEKASIELKDETTKLKQLNELMLLAMEQAGLAEFTRDDEGKIINLRLVLKVHDLRSDGSIDNVVLTPSSPRDTSNI